MSISFEKVVGSEDQILDLYNLLEKRTYNISHDKMPNFCSHKEFVLKNPYVHWFIVQDDLRSIGSFYVKDDNSIGLNLVQQEKKYVYAVIDYIKENIIPSNPVPSVIPSYFYFNIPYENNVLKEILSSEKVVPIQVSYRIL